MKIGSLLKYNPTGSFLLFRFPRDEFQKNSSRYQFSFPRFTFLKTKKKDGGEMLRPSRQTVNVSIESLKTKRPDAYFDYRIDACLNGGANFIQPQYIMCEKNEDHVANIAQRIRREVDRLTD